MNDLLVTYFDRPLSQQESAELSALLENDPPSARAFAQLARTDLAIERHFASTKKAETFDSVAAVIQSPVITRPNFNRLSGKQVAKWGVVAAVLAMLGLVITQLLSLPGDPDDVAGKISTAWEMPQPPVVPGRKSIHMANGLDRAEKRAAALLRARLGQFYLPSIAIRGKSLNAAIAEIKALMVKSDHRGSLERNPVILAGDEGSENGLTVRLVRDNLSVLNALELLAIRAGKQLVFSAVGVEMTEFSEAPDANMITTTFDLTSAPGLKGVSPYIGPRAVVATAATDSDGFSMNLDIAPEVTEFEGFVNYGSPITSEGGVDLEAKIIDGIFSSRTSDNPAQQFEIWGLSLTGDASAHWVESDVPEEVASRLAVTAGQETMNRIATLLGAVTGSLSQSALIAIETKIYEVPDSLGIEDSVLDAAGIDAFDSNIQNHPEATIVGFPSVLTGNAQRVVVESTVEQQVPIGNGETEIDHTGMTVRANPTMEGELVRLKGSVNTGFIPEQAQTEQWKAETEHLRLFPESPVIHHTVEFDAYIGPSEAAVFSMDGTKPGTTAIYVIKAKRQ
ncbi:MAG: hypothetical protein ACI9R3_004546 [Verrucomicrobiales bacterium]|jgi:hypothetical protein